MPWDRRVLVVLALLAGALIFASGVKYARIKTPTVPTVISSPGTQPAQPQVPETIKVHVSGAVSQAGVYELPAESRVTDAIQQAHPLPEADLETLNLAAPLVDGQKIQVPKPGDKTTASGTTSAVFGPSLTTGKDQAQASGTLVNINTADQAELETLTGIGPTLAQRILSYREQHGPFRALEDLKNVSGIGEGRFNQIKDQISLY